MTEFDGYGMTGDVPVVARDYSKDLIAAVRRNKDMGEKWQWKLPSVTEWQRIVALAEKAHSGTESNR